VTRILLVRHGQSEWNATGRWQGQADPPLTDFGRMQARHAAAGVGAMDAVFSSTLDRAMETAAIIADVLGIGPVLCDDDLRERDAGEFSGLTREEIEERFPGYLAADRRPDGWEPDDLLEARASAAIARIATMVGDGDVLVVTHGGLLMALETSLGAERSRPANLGGRWLVAGDGSVRLGDRIDLLDGVEITLSDQI
jgi:probable phosphoglycerate mutase